MQRDSDDNGSPPDAQRTAPDRARILRSVPTGPDHGEAGVPPETPGPAVRHPALHPAFHPVNAPHPAGRNTPARLIHSVRPGLPPPTTLVITEMDDGGLLLHGWRTGPNAFLSRAESLPLRRAIAAAYGIEPPASDGESTP